MKTRITTILKHLYLRSIGLDQFSLKPYVNKFNLLSSVIETYSIYSCIIVPVHYGLCSDWIHKIIRSTFLCVFQIYWVLFLFLLMSPYHISLKKQIANILNLSFFSPLVLWVISHNFFRDTIWLGRLPALSKSSLGGSLWPRIFQQWLSCRL